MEYPIQIPELDAFVAEKRRNDRAERLLVRSLWDNVSATAGAMRTVGRYMPEIQRIVGGRLQALGPDENLTAGGESFAQSCWRRRVPAQSRRDLCGVLGIFFEDGVSPLRLRELQLKMKLLRPDQSGLPVRVFMIEQSILAALDPSIARWVAMRLYSTGTLLYERRNGHPVNGEGCGRIAG